MTVILRYFTECSSFRCQLRPTSWSQTQSVGYKAKSAFHPSGVGKWVPAWAGKAKAGMVHSVSGCTRGVQVKLWDPLRTRAVHERLRGVITTKRYTNPRLLLPLQQKCNLKNLVLTIYDGDIQRNYKKRALPEVYNYVPQFGSKKSTNIIIIS